jgi:hypothetical protein
MDRSLCRHVRWYSVSERQPLLKPLHPETSLSPAKLAIYEKLSTDKLVKSLAPGHEHCLKTRPDGTILDGHHLVYVLKGRDIDVGALPREVIARSGLQVPED